MNRRQGRVRLLVLDPIHFRGGSKVATETLLERLDPEHWQVTVVTRDPASWSGAGYRRLRLWEPPSLARRQRGPGYFLRHLLIALQLLWYRFTDGPFHLALGASGPGVDLAFYLVRRLLRWPILQLVHGPVAASRTIGRCLSVADRVFYLEGLEEGLRRALATVDREAGARPLPSRFHSFVNGLPADRWPTPTKGGRPVILWAASLLRWKGLELLLDALRALPEGGRPETCVCYLRPRDTDLPVVSAPQPLAGVHWHEAPAELDAIRARATIFVSTSRDEPFGLSILEALAAGLCVVLPADGAYWSRTLGEDECLRYPAGDAEALARLLSELAEDPHRIAEVGAAGRRVAERYRAERLAAPIVEAVAKLSGAAPLDALPAALRDREEAPS